MHLYLCLLYLLSYLLMTIATLKSKALNICPTKLTRLIMPWWGCPSVVCGYLILLITPCSSFLEFYPEKNRRFFLFQEIAINPMVFMEELAKPNGFSGWFFY